MLKALAQRHRSQFESLLTQAGQEVEIQLPEVRTAAESPVAKVLGRGTPSPAVAPGGPSTVVPALVSTGYRAVDYEFGNVPATIAALGRTDTALVVLRCRLSDVIPAGQSAHGETLFHRAARVVVGRDAFQVVGIDRSGLPPLGPYIVWVGLKRVGSI
jgi:hypothetical protein